MGIHVFLISGISDTADWILMISEGCINKMGFYQVSFYSFFL